VLNEHGLLINTYRLKESSQITMRHAKSSVSEQCMTTCAFWSCLLPFGGPCLMPCFVKKFEVPSGSVRCIEDGRGNFGASSMLTMVTPFCHLLTVV
jgi:hypothetical protein